MTNQYPTHQRLFFGALLASIAGSLDSYTYLTHNGVFAGLQTGNCILLGVQVSKGDYVELMKYAIAIVSFVLGAILIRIIQYRFDVSNTLRHHEVFVLGYEAILMVVVALLGNRVPDMFSTALLSIVAAGQLQEFRQLKGGPFTSLMMTGNLRTLGEGLFNRLILNDSKAQVKIVDMSVIIGSFVIGAMLMGGLVPLLHLNSILLSASALVVAIIILLVSGKVV